MQLLSYVNKSKKNESGFTLIELLVVILIIGILAAIAVPIFLNQRKQALDAQLKSDMRSVATWMETNKTKNPSAPYPRIAKSWYETNGTITNFGNWPADITLSKATGVITSDSGDSQTFFSGNSAAAGAGFCIEGQVLNSNFDMTTATPQKLFYNSLKGGFTSSCQL